MHSRVTLDQVKSVMAKTELEKKMRSDLLTRLHSLDSEILHSKDLPTLEYFMGGSVWLLSFARDNGLISLDEYNDWSSTTNRKWQQRKFYLQERNNK